jgi:hypothetical protein
MKYMKENSDIISMIIFTVAALLTLAWVTIKHGV